MRVDRSICFLSLSCALACSGDPYPDSGTGGASSSAGGNISPGGSSNGGSTGAGGPGSGGTSALGGAAAGGAAAGGASTGSGGSVQAAGGAAAAGSAQTSGGSRQSSGGAAQGSGGAAQSSGGAITDPQQFYAVNCALCHGPRGEGVASLGPEVQHPVRDFSTWVVRNGRQGHPSFPASKMAAFTPAALPDAVLNGIWDWLSTPALAKPTTGQALFHDYCSNCHATGVGGTAGHNAKGEPLATVLQMVRGGHSLTQFSSRTGYMSKWTASELTDAEVGLIVSYLDAL